MAFTWKKEKRPAKNHVAEDSDEIAGSYMGQGAGQSTGQVCMHGEVLLRPYVPDGTKRIRE